MTQYPLSLQILMIGCIVMWATAGDVLIAASTRKIGDLDRIRAVSGIPGAAAAVLRSPRFGLGVVCMALSFFSMLFALSHGELTLIGPAAAALTFVTNAIAAKFFLGENVDRHRWLAAAFVCIGVVLLAH